MPTSTASNPPQTLLICGGGGLQGSFITGALSQLQALNARQFDHITDIFATSASMPSMLYFLSHHKNHKGKHIWTQEIPNSNFLSFKSFKCLFSGKPIYDIDHLVDVIFKQRNPLNIERIKNTHHHFAFPILNIDTGELEIFSNLPKRAKIFFPTTTVRNWQDYDLYELIRATCAIPILYDRPVTLGQNRYCDAGISHPFLVPEVMPPNTHSLCIIVRSSPDWKADLKAMLTGTIWNFRARRGKTQLPKWVYSYIIKKPFILLNLTRQLRKIAPQTFIIKAHTPLLSSLQNTPESALHNWRAGEDHITARQTEIAHNFWNLLPCPPLKHKSTPPNP